MPLELMNAYSIFKNDDREIHRSYLPKVDYARSRLMRYELTRPQFFLSKALHVLFFSTFVIEGLQASDHIVSICARRFDNAFHCTIDFLPSQQSTF